MIRATRLAICVQNLKGELTDFNLDCTNLYEYDPDLYKQLILYPQELIPIFDIEVNTIAADNAMDDAEPRIQVRSLYIPRA